MFKYYVILNLYQLFFFLYFFLKRYPSFNCRRILQLSCSKEALIAAFLCEETVKTGQSFALLGLRWRWRLLVAKCFFFLILICILIRKGSFNVFNKIKTEVNFKRSAPVEVWNVYLVLLLLLLLLLTTK